MANKKHKLFSLSYVIVLVVFTLYVLMDTFVIARSYVVIDESSDQAVLVSQSVTENSTGTSQELIVIDVNDTIQTSESEASDTDDNLVQASETTVTDSTYSDANMTITISEYREYDTSIYVADIVLSSAEYLSTAFANNTYGKNVKEATSTIADQVNAILAINGDFYGAHNEGYVIRNGVLYRESSSDDDQEDLVIYEDGTFEIISEGQVDADELLASGAGQVLSFGPGLIMDGQIEVSAKDEVDKAKTSNPRTAIGVIDDLHYVMIVSDGRTDESEGLTLYELAQFMEELGVSQGYNLDGGGSSTMVFMGQVVNNPTSDGKRIKERSVSDIVYIGY